MEAIRLILSEYGILLYAVVVCFVLYMAYTICKSAAVLRREKISVEEEGEGVSVILTAHNCAAVLEKNLINYLNQDYPNYEVIVVDECSEDDTQEVLSLLQQEYPQLKCTRVYPNTKFRFTKKLAINIGILSAKYDILLFAEAWSTPSSSSWIRTMQSYFDKDTAVVVGFASYRTGESARRRYFRLSRFVEMWWMLKLTRYSWGEGCNMGYRKSDYIKNRGFAGKSQHYLGYDNDMVHDLSAYGEVKVVKHPDSYVVMDRLKSEEEMDKIAYYFASKAKSPLWLRVKISADKFLRLLLYIGMIYLVKKGFPLVYVLSAALFLYLVDVFFTCLHAKHFKQKRLVAFSLVANAIGFMFRWYWNGYSFFNQKKWR